MKDNINNTIDPSDLLDDLDDLDDLDLIRFIQNTTDPFDLLDDLDLIRFIQLYSEYAIRTDDNVEINKIIIEINKIIIINENNENNENNEFGTITYTTQPNCDLAVTVVATPLGSHDTCELLGNDEYSSTAD